MVPLNPKITNAGLALFPNPTAPGFQVTLTHVAIGTAKYAPNGSETGLAAEVARFPIVGGGSPAPNQVQIAANITDTDPNGHSANDQWIGEIGFFAGATLFAVWSKPTTPLFYKTSAFDIPIAYTMDISRLPSGSVTVTVQAGEAAMQSMVFAHENKADPHPQYLTPTEADALFLTQTEGDSRYMPVYGQFPSGTRLLFQQTAAPTGWTKDVTHNDKALRVVSGAAGSGGATDFSSIFSARATQGTAPNTSGPSTNTSDGPSTNTSGATTLTTAQIPSHGGHVGTLASVAGGLEDGQATPNYPIESRGGDGSHTHDLQSHTHTLGNHYHTVTSHAHNIDMAVKYVDIILCSKD